MILVRHGESQFNVIFNVTREDPGIIDPGLTETGLRQAEAAARTLADRDIRRIVASPYSRTLHTAEIVAQHLSLPVEVEPLVRERTYFTCDIGTPRSELGARWPEFDFGELPERWWPEPEESEAELHGRCAAFRALTADGEDWRHVAVVSHWGFIRALTGQEVTNGTLLPFDPRES
ncbi:MAG: histidine phosphatase family protein [Kiloniellales bacterium]|jgi:broad specificity phosphatase PhoE